MWGRRAPLQVSSSTILSAVMVVPARATGNDKAWLEVADPFQQRVQIWTRSDTVVRILEGTSNAAIPLDKGLDNVTVCVSTWEVLVTDPGNQHVLARRTADGGVLRVVCGRPPWWLDDDMPFDEIGRFGFIESSGGADDVRLLYEPSGVVASSDGALWVADRQTGLCYMLR
jgi:hypothetical protein